MKQPTHKTTHLQAQTHKTMLQLAKELFFSTHEEKTTVRHGLADLQFIFDPKQGKPKTLKSRQYLIIIK